MSLLTVSVGTNLLFLQPTAVRNGVAAQGDLSTGSIGRGGGFDLGPGRVVEVASPMETIRAVQRELNYRGYEVGTPDGKRGLVTQAAIMAYEYDHGLPLTGEASEGLLKQILLGEAPMPARPKTSSERSATAEAVIRKVQTQLAAAGYQPVKPTGHIDEDTVRAIREFESDQKLPETGRVSGQLVARLALQGRQAKR